MEVDEKILAYILLVISVVVYIIISKISGCLDGVINEK